MVMSKDVWNIIFFEGYVVGFVNELAYLFLI